MKKISLVFFMIFSFSFAQKKVMLNLEAGPSIRLASTDNVPEEFKNLVNELKKGTSFRGKAMYLINQNTSVGLQISNFNSRTATLRNGLAYLTEKDNILFIGAGLDYGDKFPKIIISF